LLSNLLGKITLFSVLFNIDTELAAAHKQQGCPRCRGPLHQGGYERKARGELCEVPEAYRHRHNFCCGWCRRRSLAPSLLFWGRRVYWGPAVVLSTASRQGKSGASYAYLRRLVGASASTVRRWMAYFTQVFPREPQWVARRGHVRADVPNDRLPGALLTFMGLHRTPEATLVATLRFLVV
jgi:hypothetical protein